MNVQLRQGKQEIIHNFGEETSQEDIWTYGR